MTPKIRPADADETPRASAEAPPREAPKPPPEPPKRNRRGTDAKLKQSLTQFYATIGGGVSTIGMLKGDVGLFTSGTNIGTRAEETAEAWLELADSNERVKRFLESFMEGSAVANVIAAHLAMVVPILAARGLIPEQAGVMFLNDEAKEAAQQFMAFAASQTENGNGGSGN